MQWHHGWSTVTKNPNGTTGWATMLQSSSPKRPIGTVRRIHLCAANPCLARWPASKYGVWGPPLHLQLVEAPDVPSAVAESSGQAASSAPSAVAEFLGILGQAESSVPPAVAESSVPPTALPPADEPPQPPLPPPPPTCSPGLFREPTGVKKDRSGNRRAPRALQTSFSSISHRFGINYEWVLQAFVT